MISSTCQPSICSSPCSQISPRPLAFLSPVPPPMCISPASSNCPPFFSSVSHKLIPSSPALLLEGLWATGSCSISEWTKSNYVFGSSLLGKITCCWWAKATGFVPVPGVVALVGALRAKWGQWAGPWHKGVDLSRAQAAPCLEHAWSLVLLLFLFPGSTACPTKTSAQLEERLRQPRCHTGHPCK